MDRSKYYVAQIMAPHDLYQFPACCSLDLVTILINHITIKYCQIWLKNAQHDFKYFIKTNRPLNNFILQINCGTLITERDLWIILDLFLELRHAINCESVIGLEAASCKIRIQRHIGIDDLKVRRWTELWYQIIPGRLPWSTAVLQVLSPMDLSREEAFHKVRRHLLFPFCPSVLKPCFDLCVGEAEVIRQANSFGDC